MYLYTEMSHCDQYQSLYVDCASDFDTQQYVNLKRNNRSIIFVLHLLIGLDKGSK